MITNNPTQNTITKRESTNREYISKAALIGLCNLYGVDFVLKIVNKTSRAKITVDNILIEECSLFPVTDAHARRQQVSQMTRNELKSYEAVQINSLGEYLFSTFGLNYQLAKSRTATKTVKMFKYRWIDPFNEEGFTAFGRKIIETVYGMERSQTTQKHSYVRVERNNPVFYGIYCSVIANPEMMTPVGAAMVSAAFSQTQLQQVEQIEQIEQNGNQMTTQSETQFSQQIEIKQETPVIQETQQMYFNPCVEVPIGTENGENMQWNGYCMYHPMGNSEMNGNMEVSPTGIEYPIPENGN